MKATKVTVETTVKVSVEKAFIIFIWEITFIGFHIPHFFEPTIKIVRMNGMKFVPETVEVNIGDTVLWINE